MCENPDVKQQDEVRYHVKQLQEKFFDYQTLKKLPHSSYYSASVYYWEPEQMVDFQEYICGMLSEKEIVKELGVLANCCCCTRHTGKPDKWNMECRNGGCECGFFRKVLHQCGIMYVEQEVPYRPDALLDNMYGELANSDTMLRVCENDYDYNSFTPDPSQNSLNY